MIVTLLARTELFNQAESKLTAVREIKQRQIESMFQDFAAGLKTVSAVVAAELKPDQPESLHKSLEAIGKELSSQKDQIFLRSLRLGQIFMVPVILFMVPTPLR